LCPKSFPLVVAVLFWGTRCPQVHIAMAPTTVGILGQLLLVPLQVILRLDPVATACAWFMVQVRWQQQRRLQRFLASECRQADHPAIVMARAMRDMLAGCWVLTGCRGDSETQSRSLHPEAYIGKLNNGTALL
jgi:hypothetical protein